MTIAEIIETNSFYAVNEFTGEAVSISVVYPLEAGVKPQIKTIRPMDKDLSSDMLCNLLFDEDAINKAWRAVGAIEGSRIANGL